MRSRITFKIGALRVSIPVKILIPVVIVGLLLMIPFSANAEIDKIQGEFEDDCEHSFVDGGYNSETNVITYVCEKCGDTRTEKLEFMFMSDVSCLSMLSEQDLHQHNYELISFDKDSSVGVVKCRDCDDTFEDAFHDHITTTDGQGNLNTDTYVPWFDRNSDDVINVQDLLYCIRDFPPAVDDPVIPEANELITVLSDNHFYFKEIFFYVYSTVVLCAFGLILIIFARRTA